MLPLRTLVIAHHADYGYSLGPLRVLLRLTLREQLGEVNLVTKNIGKTLGKLSEETRAMTHGN